MRVLIPVAFCLSVHFMCSWAWEPPERCKKMDTGRSLTADTKNHTIVPVIESSTRTVNRKNELNTFSSKTRGKHDFDISKLAKSQEQMLKKKYKDYKFSSIPVRGHFEYRGTGKIPIGPTNWLEFYSSYDCSFKCQKERLLSSVACHGLNCKLEHQVSAVDTYTSTEGVNWDAKVTASAGGTIFGVGLQIGGEYSKGGEYSCSFSKGKTTTETVDCDVESRKSGILELYLMKSDMECSIGKVKMQRDKRKGKFWVEADVGRNNQFKFKDADEIERNIHIQIKKAKEPSYIENKDEHDFLNSFMIDVTKISDRVLKKIKQKFPLFNPNTDSFSITNFKFRELSQNSPNKLPGRNMVRVDYYKKKSAEEDRRIKVPFTNENGDSEFKYACILSPLEDKPL